MLWLTAYYDACGHPDAKHVLAVGGYISSTPAWLRFEKRWKRTLKPDGITVPFHMSDFMACKDDFVDWEGRYVEQLKLLLKLSRIIKDNVRRGFSTMIVLDDWRDVNRIYALDKNHCTPYALCGFFTMNKTVRWLKGRTRRFNIRFIFENGDKHKGDFIWVMDQLIKRNKRDLGGAKPHFESKELSPLQACDFAMWEQLNIAKDRLKNPDSPARLRQTFKELAEIPGGYGVISKDRLIRFCEDYDVPKRGESRLWVPFPVSTQKGHAGGQH